MLLLRRSEVSVGRSGVWRLHEPVEGLSAELIALANGGRMGTLSRD
jgi:hypothetical protein